MSYFPRLLEEYRGKGIQRLNEKFGYANPMMVPKLEKIVVNMGVGEANENPKFLETAIEDMTIICGQKPIIKRSKKAISNFKLRAGTPVGCCVTLRGWRMYEFMDRLISVAIPRVRDFRGISSTSFDGRGNYNMGLKEQTIFPEIDYDKVDKVRGMNITMVTSANTDEEAHELLASLGMPFKKKNQTDQ